MNFKLSPYSMRLIGTRRSLFVHTFVTINAVILLCSGCSSYSSNQSQQYSSTPLKTYGDQKTGDPRLVGPPAYREPIASQSAQPSQRSTYRTSSISGSDLPSQHKATSRLVRLNREAGSSLAKLDGVGLAYVIQMDDNAYVALALNGGGLGMKATGGDSTREQLGVGYKYPGTAKVSRTPFAAPNVVDKNSSLRSVSSSKDLSHEFRQTVAVTLREMLPNINDVYISANADFFNQVSAYATKIYPATSLTGYRNEIHQLIRESMK
ncbi:YhcN/YlaJ family sporulation lipoprotein [Paenibacillus sp. 1001270B_150601_E10]|uniref:YhcN/YlaJ family sporulation lipoprotein n=1 Tax=Paenibacillus sp. 1001270B_150601_E10 TaxID=2787079 RepID=UPI00189EAA62|nr:YhcN/YlaJ family sporulation lipoprotein [Paenibacillus sp. 1001270B_150601_E10]